MLYYYADRNLEDNRFKINNKPEQKALKQEQWPEEGGHAGEIEPGSYQIYTTNKTLIIIFKDLIQFSSLNF